MSEKHQIFIESMVKMSKVSPDYVAPIKAITESYVINEGIVDWFKGFANKAKDVLKNDPAKLASYTQDIPLSPNDKMILRSDKETFDTDYRMFHKALNALNMYLSNFGDTEYINYVMKPEFDKAIRRGGYVDNIRKKAGIPNPVTEAVNRAMQFCAVLESISAMGFNDVAKSAYETYMITEAAMGIPTKFMFESSFNDAAAIMEMARTPEQKERESKANDILNGKIMPIIARFIAKHGRAAWDKFLRSSNYRMAKSSAEKIRTGMAYGAV
jgi:hypothetical protein